MKHLIYTLALSLCFVTACREEEIVSTATPPAEGSGFYLLNEGNMGTNKARLDYCDFATGEYKENVYSGANPSVPKDLGDVGNDLEIYGSKLYAVINCSNKVEVMDSRTARRVGKVDIPNCRYITFHEGYAYVTSYAGPVEITPDYVQHGFVAKIDTTTLQEVARCLVGFQPDELAVANGKLYVANSGGYMTPNYETTLSVIDLATFSETKRIEVAQNLHRVEADKHGTLWVSSRGDYLEEPSRLHWIDTQTDTYGGSLDITVSEMTIVGDSLYLLGSSFNYNTYQEGVSYGIVDVTKREIISHNFISDGTEAEIQMPYGLMVHPITKDIYLTDAANKVYPGTLFCFNKDGEKQWEKRAGDVPAHFAILYR